ncbi:MAG: alpha/beta hydrolase [Rhizobiales bacterium]|nr:alpha/beta hydrolase [Hyphomicrobiales bacterium]
MPLKSGFGLLRLQADMLWASAEYGLMLLGDNALNAMVPKGDGETPVMTLPGFAGPEYSLTPLNKFLRANGYRARSWGMGTNKGLRDRSHMNAVVRQLGHRIRESNDKYGRAVSLVGQSLGGLIAREVARQMPHEIDRVITLGTPAHFADAPESALEAVADMMALYTGAPRSEHMRELLALGPDLGDPPPRVPLVSVFSRTDGVTPVETAIIPERYLDPTGKKIRENVEITCSHCGMGVNPLVLLTIADRLAADKNDWQPIDLTSYLPEPIKSLYPLVRKGFAAT